MPCPSIYEVTFVGLVRARFQDGMNLILANAYTYTDVRPYVKKISINPRELGVVLNDLFPLPRCQMLGKLPYCQIIFHICVPWRLDCHGKRMFIWELVVHFQWIIYLWDSREKINNWVFFPRRSLIVMSNFCKSNSQWVTPPFVIGLLAK